MKSKFMKSMQLLWQASPTVDEEDETLREKENARQDCSVDPDLAKEYVRALTEEQIPQPLLDKMADLINESIPELVRQSIDKEAEKRNIYNHLLSPFTDYIRFIYEKIQTEGSSQWKQDEIRLKEQVKELNDYIHELSSKQEEFQSQYLSAERQKRALGERVHELEMRIVTFEAEKEQSDMEKSALNNKLKVAAVQEKNKADELAALQEEKSRLEQELVKARQIDRSLPDKLREATEKANSLQKQLDTIVAKQQDADNALGILQTENTGLREEIDRIMIENKDLHESLTKVLHAKDDAVRQAVEREEMLKRKVDSLLLEKQQLSDLSVSKENEIESVRNELRVLTEELEKQKSADEMLNETLEAKARLEAALSESEDQMRSLKQNIENEERRSGELQSSVKLLESRIDLLEKEKNGVSALLEKKSAELEIQRKQSEEIGASLKDMADLKHQLLVANDMLAAVKSQRQELFAEIEKEKSERTELQQKLLVSEETVRQFENDQQIDRKNIRALMAEIDALKDELKKNTRDSRFLDEPEELDWLVPTRPDTPEEIARKKAEKKLQEKELMAEEEKTEIKPDPSQMSLW